MHNDGINWYLSFESHSQVIAASSVRGSKDELVQRIIYNCCLSLQLIKLTGSSQRYSI